MVKSPKKDGIISDTRSPEWGTYHHLNPSQSSSYQTLQSYLSTNPHLNPTVYNFQSSHEPPTDALCRWLRARKFDVEATKQMIVEASECRRVPEENEFYKSAQESLRIHPSIYLTLYPQGYFGFAKNGSPVYISRPSHINVSTLDCCLSLTNILRYHWHAMQVEFGDMLRVGKGRDGEMKFQCVCVVDLRGLNVGQLNKKTMRVIKEQSAIDSLCYPETMCKMIVLNVPGFFNLSWKIIKTFVDKRTVSKVELISNRQKGERRLKELIDLDQLPEDYGGNAMSTTEQMEETTKEEGVVRRIIEFVRLGRATVSLHLSFSEFAKIEVHTKSSTDGHFTLVRSTSSNSSPRQARHNLKGHPESAVATCAAHNRRNPKNNGVTDEFLTHASITKMRGRDEREEVAEGPGDFKIVAQATGGGLFSGSHDFLVVVNVFNRGEFEEGVEKSFSNRKGSDSPEIWVEKNAAGAAIKYASPATAGVANGMAGEEQNKTKHNKSKSKRGSFFGRKGSTEN